MVWQILYGSDRIRAPCCRSHGRARRLLVNNGKQTGLGRTIALVVHMELQLAQVESGNYFLAAEGLAGPGNCGMTTANCFRRFPDEAAVQGKNPHFNRAFVSYFEDREANCRLVVDPISVGGEGIGGNGEFIEGFSGQGYIDRERIAAYIFGGIAGFGGLPWSGAPAFAGEYAQGGTIEKDRGFIAQAHQGTLPGYAAFDCAGEAIIGTGIEGIA